MKLRITVLGICLALFAAGLARGAELRISRQYGINYLPLLVLEQHKIIEKKAKEAGLGEVSTSWITLAGGAAANDALLSGSVDIIALGVPPFIRLWDKSKGQAKALAPLSEFPPSLTTNNPDVKTFKDFTEKDRIALPAAKVSLQALLLQIAVAREYGIAAYDRLDRLTVTMSHPDGLLALTSGKSEITGHFTQEPFLTAELKHPGIHKVLDGYDVLGAATYQLLATTTKFYEQNRKLAEIFVKALEEADAWIAADKKRAAELYVKVTKSKESPDEILGMLQNPHGGFSVTPKSTTAFSNFLYEVKAIGKKPADWKELYFPLVYDKAGS
ncbi:MAG: ABC transporter substrate-binding protein [Desulfovibrio sp.]|jgi:NitT/TauT family transport system substrate-binding protein|nr:ABC transporter substrate-binding protein [Desulfovibrio sp.]